MYAMFIFCVKRSKIKQGFLRGCGSMAARSPILKKAEEKAKKEDPDSKDADTVSPPKRLCTIHAKRLAKLPEGDQGLVKDRCLKHDHAF